jgi:ribosomal protein L11 methyltransferase
VANASVNNTPLMAGLPDLANGEYALVMANILATPLKVLAPLLCAHVQIGGDLILAGILSRQSEELKVAYAPYVALRVLDEQEGWVLMGAHKH